MTHRNSIGNYIQSITDDANSLCSNSTVSTLYPFVPAEDEKYSEKHSIYNNQDNNYFIQPFPSYSCPFIVASWNIGGINNNFCNNSDNECVLLKQQIINILHKDIQSDIICFQEFRNHYFGPGIIENYDVPFVAPDFLGYFKFADFFCKNVIYIKSKYFAYSDEIQIPDRNTNISDFENHHWVKWCIIHKHPHNALPYSVVIGSYWLSPSRTMTSSDITNLNLDLKFIRNLYKNEPFEIIQAGDYNIHHPSISLPSCLKYTKRDYIEYAAFSDMLETFNLNIVNNLNEGTYRYKTRHSIEWKWSLLDYQLFSEQLVKNEYHHQLLKYKGLQHIPLLTVLSLSTDRNATNLNQQQYEKIASYKWRFNNPINLEKYKSDIVEKFDSIQKQYEPIIIQKQQQSNNIKDDLSPIIDDIGYDIHTETIQIASSNIGLYRTRKNKHRKPWCNEKVIKISKKTNKIFKKYIWSKKHNIRTLQHMHHKWLYWVKIRGKVCNEAKKDYAMLLAKKCNIHDAEWWKVLKRIENFEKSLNIQSVPFLFDDGYESGDIGTTFNDNLAHLDRCIYDDYKKANIFNGKLCYKLFKTTNPRQRDINLQQIPTVPNTVYPQNNLKRAERIKNPELRAGNRYSTNLELKVLNADINDEEIKFALFSLNKSCSYGLGLHIKLFTIIIHQIISFIRWIFNLCLNVGHYAKIWKMAHVVVHLKPQRDSHYFDNYRKITIMGIFRKWMEKIISNRILRFVINLKLIHPNYMAALRGKSAWDAAMMLLHNVGERLDRNLLTYAVKFDVESCYRSVQYDIMMQRTEEFYGMKGRICVLIFDLFRDSWCRTIVNGVGSDWMAQIEGLGEGKVLSVVLNMLYITPLIYVVENQDIFDIIIYVDDILLYTLLNYPSNYIINALLQKQIDLMVQWLADNNMKFSIKKTKSITFNSNHIINRYSERIATISLHLLPHEQIEHIDNNDGHIKYLGFHINTMLNKTYHINIIVRRICNGFIKIKKMFKNIHGALAITYLYITRAYIMSILEYHYLFLSNATKSELKPLQTTYHRILRYLTGTFKSTPLETIHWLSTFGALSTILKSKSAKWWTHNITLHDDNPLFAVMEKIWFPRYKRDLFGENKGKYKLKRYAKKSHFNVSFQNAKNFNLLNMYKIERTTNYVDFGQVLKYFPLNIKRPINVKYIAETYTDYSYCNFVGSALYIFCDGSLQNNLGGIGASFELHINASNYQYITNVIRSYSVYLGLIFDINIVELIAIKLAIKYLLEDDIILDAITNIYVISDNREAILSLVGCRKIKTMNIYKLVKNILTRIGKSELLNNKLIHFIHCKRGKWSGNIRADNLAKTAVCDRLFTEHISIGTIISANVFKTKLKKLCLEDLYDKMDAILQRKRSYMIFYSKIYREYKVIKDFYILTRYQMGILNQLRTGHINLNSYRFWMNHRDISTVNPTKCVSKCCKNWNGGYCRCCDTFEDVIHFVAECRRYNRLRKQYIYPIYRLLIRLECDLDIINILFPPSDLRSQHRKMILSNLTEYALKTGRIKIY